VTAETRPAFARVLGRGDLFLFTVSAVLTIDSLASAASMGQAWFAWWAIVVAAFFVPYGLITAELGAAWPGEGGLYVWVREAFGARWGGMAAWLYWINVAYWMPSIFVVFASTFFAIFLPGRPASAGLEAALALLLTWLSVWIGVIRLSVSKWIPNLGGVVKLAIFAALGGLGLAALLSGRPAANPLSWAGFAPRLSDSLAFLPVLLYNALGFELMSGAGDEMRDPQRDVPRTILLAGALIGATYALGVFGILWAVPLERLSLVTGTWDALALLGRAWGTAGDAAVLLLGVGFLYACVANVVTYALGANRVLAQAAEEGALPRSLGRLHPRHRTPYVAFLWTGIVGSVLLAGNALVGAGSSNVFWMLFKLAGLCFLFCYLMLFPAFARLRVAQPERPRPYRLPGGEPLARAAAALCWLFVAVACVLFFRPSPDADAARALRETWLLAGECLATLLAGLWLASRARRTT
jgi:amino acid transporter